MTFEPIITAKVYDSCRAQECLMSIARAAEPITINGRYIEKNKIIPVIYGAGSVTINNFNLIKSNIISKQPSSFQNGFWIIEVEFVYEYTLNFQDCNKNIILRAKAYSANTKRYKLFGSVSAEATMATDAFGIGCLGTSSAEPFVVSESSAVALKAEFRCNHRDLQPVDVAVTIGLFSIAKLVRMVGLDVQSQGFCTPRKCDSTPINPCSFFKNSDFLI